MLAVERREQAESDLRGEWAVVKETMEVDHLDLKTLDPRPKTSYPFASVQFSPDPRIDIERHVELAPRSTSSSFTSAATSSA